MDYFVERSPVGTHDWLQWSVGRVPESKHVGADPIRGRSDDAPARFLVANSRVPATYTKVGRRQHHRHRRLAKVVLVNRADALIFWQLEKKHHRRLGRGEMMCACPNRRQLLQLRGIRHKHEVPWLPVHRGRRSPSRLENSLEVLGRNGPVLIGTNVAPSSDCVPGLHAFEDILASPPANVNQAERADKGNLAVAWKAMVRPLIEVERKFVLEEGAEIPGFETFAPSLRVGSIETLDLEALYYDTTDLRLARSGATLGVRLSGRDARWHLKLPGSELEARIEFQRPAPHLDAVSWFLDPPAVPDELVDLTLSRTGGLELRLVVRLTTGRTRTVLVGPDSQPLVVFDEDDVGAFFDSGDEAHHRWKELEVKLLEGTQRELDSISRELERLGGRPADYPSKFVRAIGSAACRPFMAKPATGKKATDSLGAIFCKRWCDLVLELVARDVGVRRGDEESVHKMRVAIRRLRSALKTFTPVLDKASARWLRDELGWLGGVLGPLRDTDVLQEHLQGLLDSLAISEVIGPVRDEISAHLAETRQRALAEALEVMRSDRYLSLLEVLRAVGQAPPTKAKAKRGVKKGGPWLMGRDLRRVALRVEAAKDIEEGVERARALHEVRKAAKGARYAGETFEPLLGKPAARIARRFAAIHEMLGSGQDAVTARVLLRELGARPGGRPGHNGYTYGLLVGLEETRFRHAASELPELWKAASSPKLWDSLRDA